jgi:hypothetical protein
MFHPNPKNWNKMFQLKGAGEQNVPNQKTGTGNTSTAEPKGNQPNPG